MNNKASGYWIMNNGNLMLWKKNSLFFFSRFSLSHAYEYLRVRHLELIRFPKWSGNENKGGIQQKKKKTRERPLKMTV